MPSRTNSIDRGISASESSTTSAIPTRKHIVPDQDGRNLVIKSVSAKKRIGIIWINVARTLSAELTPCVRTSNEKDKRKRIYTIEHTGKKKRYRCRSMYEHIVACRTPLLP